MQRLSGKSPVTLLGSPRLQYSPFFSICFVFLTRVKLANRHVPDAYMTAVMTSSAYNRYILHKSVVLHQKAQRPENSKKLIKIKKHSFFEILMKGTYKKKTTQKYIGFILPRFCVCLYFWRKSLFGHIYIILGLSIVLCPLYNRFHF